MIKMTVPPINEPTNVGRRSKKVKYNTNSLPFPPSRAMAHSQMWRRIYKPSIIEFAASHFDPFGTNSLLETPALTLWNHIYGESSEEAIAPGTAGRAAVIQVVRVFVVYLCEQ